MIILRRRHQLKPIQLSSTKIGKMGMTHLLGYTRKDIQYNDTLRDVEEKIIKASMIPKEYFNDDSTRYTTDDLKELRKQMLKDF